MAKKENQKGGGGKKKKKGGLDVGTVDPGAPSPSRAHYSETVSAKLRERFQYRSPMEIPRLTKIVVNMGVGDAVANIKMLDSAVDELALITGQKPSIRRAKKSIATFKLREGQPIGAKVTLRGARMWEFFDRLTMVALPRIRDFRGLPNRSFDGRGNYTFGIKEQVVFPEVDYDKVEKIRGMDVTLVTTAKSDEEGMELLTALKWPFRK